MFKNLVQYMTTDIFIQFFLINGGLEKMFRTNDAIDSLVMGGEDINQAFQMMKDLQPDNENLKNFIPPAKITFTKAKFQFDENMRLDARGASVKFETMEVEWGYTDPVKNEFRLHAIGFPAKIIFNTGIKYHKHGLLTRKNDPAVTYTSAQFRWYKDGIQIREYGPSYVSMSSIQLFLTDGQLQVDKNDSFVKNSTATQWNFAGTSIPNDKVEELLKMSSVNFDFLACDRVITGEFDDFTLLTEIAQVTR